MQKSSSLRVDAIRSRAATSSRSCLPPPGRPRAAWSAAGALLVFAAAPFASAQNTVVLTDAQGFSVEVGSRGLVQLTAGSETFRFADVHPLILRTTSLAGGHVSYREYDGEQLNGVQTQVTAVSRSLARVAWSNCRLQGVSGTFDLVYEYELVPPPYGPGVAIRGRIARNTLALGIAAVAYREYLQGSNEPVGVIGGFTGAVQVTFDDLVTGTLDITHPYMATGGELTIGSRPEQFVSTRSGDSLLVAATLHGNRRNGLLMTRDGRQDEENVGREFGLFGANNVRQDPRPEFGFGVISYLPNDDRPANGGDALSIGAGIVLAPFAQENAAEPYWDVVRAYRTRWVDPMLIGIDKRKERPEWLARTSHLVINVADAGFVRHEAVATFLDEYLQENTNVRDLAVLLWGALGTERFTEVNGLSELMTKIGTLEAKRNIDIRTSLYYLPTFYEAAANGGTRLDEVCRDPFGIPYRFQADPRFWTYVVDVGGAPNAKFYSNWLATVPPRVGADGVYFDDSFRHRTFNTWHYDPQASVQGRTEKHVAAYIGQMREASAKLASSRTGGYLVTELGHLGSTVPGNLVQGVGGLEPMGPFFASDSQVMQLQPFLNDVAGHHWLAGYAGTIQQSWIYLQDVDDLLYFSTSIVRGLAPVLAPLALNNKYYDFFQLCRDHIIDCGDPRFRAVGMQSGYANDGMGFHRRHNDILTQWRREPLPGTHDIQKHEIAFVNANGGAWRSVVDEVPYGCFSNGDRVAIALTNPCMTAKTVSFRLQRGRYGMALDGNYRVTLQRLGDQVPKQLLERATGDLVFSVTLASREWAMVMVEPVPYSWSSTPNVPGCTGGGTLTGSTGGVNGVWVTLTLTGATKNAPAVMVYGHQKWSYPLPLSSCELLIDLNGAILLPFGTDANGRASLRFAVGAATARMQTVTVDFAPAVPVIHASNAVTLHFP